MASKKRTKYETSDFDIDSELDLPDFDFEEPKLKDDRKPAVKVGKSVLKGAGEAVLNPSIIRSTIRRSLPDSYGDALGVADEASDSLRSLYDHAEKEFKPAINDLKSITRRVLPYAEGKLPKRLAEKLKAFSQEESRIDLSAERQRNDSIAMELGDIFRIQAEEDQKQRQSDQKAEQFKQGIEQIRHRDQLGVLGAIADGVGRQVAYQDRVLANYQKKSLELQFRQYYALVDMVEGQRKMAADVGGQLAGILKNTGLPEFVKIKESERFQEISRNKFMENIREGLFGGTTDYVKKFLKNVTANAKSKVSDWAQSIGSATSGIDMASSMLDSAGDGIDYKEFGGELAGGMAAQYGIGKGQDWLKRKLKDNPALAKGAENIRYRLDNSGQLLQDYFSDYNKSWGPLNGLKDFLGDSLPGLRPDTAVDKDALNKMHEPAIFTQAASKSIIEIIPGLLSRIHREIHVLRTGDTSAGLVAYDYGTNKFSTEKAIGERLTSKVGTKDNRRMVGDRLDDLMKVVDPNNKLDAKQKEALRSQLLNISTSRSSTDARHMTDAQTWAGMGSGAHYVAGVFSDLFQVDPATGQRGSSLEAIRNQRIFSEKMRQLTKYVNDPRADIQQLSNLGQRDVLSGSGLLAGDNVSLENLNALLGGKDLAYQDANALAGGGSRRDRRRRAKLGQPAAPSVIQQATEAPVASALTESIDRLTDTFKASTSNDTNKLMADTLLRLEERINKGVLVFTAGQAFDGVMPEHYDGPAVKGMKKDAGPKKGFGQFTLSDILQGVTSGASRLGGLAANLGGRAFGLGGRVMSTVATQGGALLGKGAGLAGQGWETAKAKVGDLYIKGEVEPRLLRAKMVAGEYIDQATGKVIESFDDIKGTIVDRAGNVIIQAGELKDAFMQGRPIQLLSSIVKTGFSFLKKAGGIAGRIAGGIYGYALSAGIAAFKTIQENLPAYDVYIKGEREPIMFAAQMKLGKYFSKKTGVQIRHPSQIDGEVIDADGNYVISEDMLKTGLVDVKGTPVGSKLQRLFGNVGEGVRTGFGFLKGIASGAKNLLTNFGGALNEFFGGIFGPNAAYTKISESQLDVQLQILKLLDERLPRKGGVAGDVDGDGIRDNSVQDILNKRAAEKEERQASAEQAKQGGGDGILGASLKGLAGLFNRNKDEEESDEEGGDTYIDLGGDSSDDKKDKKGKKAAKAKKPKAPAKPKSWGGKLAGLAKKGGKAAWSLGKGAGSLALSLAGIGGPLGWLLRGASVASPFLAPILGGAASMAGSALGGLATVGGGMLGLAGSALGGLFAILTSPVSLAALGIGAAAYAGYKAYKYYTRAVLTPINSVRFAQYGFSKAEENKLPQIVSLENALAPAVSLNGSDAKLDDSKVKLEDLMEDFGVEKTNDRAVKNWMTWFNNRFKPVFLGHMAVTKARWPNLGLGQLDAKLKPKEKIDYIEATRMPGMNYGAWVSPFPDIKVLPVDTRGVNSAIEIALAAVKKEEKEADQGKAVGVGAALGVMGVGAKEAQDYVDSVNALEKTDPEQAKKLKEGNAYKDALKKMAAFGTVAQKDEGVRISGESTVPTDYLFTGDPGRLDALTALRFKVYGLNTLDVDKIKALRYLEIRLQNKLNFTDVGATYATDIEALCEESKSYFGLSGARSPQGYRWMSWFRSRFLPVYLNFATALEKLTKKRKIADAELVLKAQDAPSVATAIYTTKVTYEGKEVTPWDVLESPWRDYPLNGDPKSIDGNIDALTGAAKAVVAGEHTSPAVKAENQKKYAEAIKNNQTVNPKTAADTAGGAAITFQKTPKTVAQQRAGVSEVMTNSAASLMNSDGSGVRAQGDFAGGSPVRHPGAGTGGDVNSIPDPQGRSGWDAVGPTILAAAKMVGVDPKTLASIAAIESGFDPNARPINKKTGQLYSSAKGLFQFIDGTWNDQMKANAKKYGIAVGTTGMDARANALLGAEFVKSNIEYLKRNLKRPITDTDVYIAHFMGPGGAVKFLTSDPNAIAEQVMPKEAAANPWIFRTKDGRPRTFGEIYQLFSDKLKNKLAQAGVPAGAFGSTAMAEAAKPMSPSGMSAAPVTSSPSTAAAPAAPKAAEAVTAVASSPTRSSAVAPDSAAAGYAASMRPTAAPTASASPAPAVASRPAGFGGFNMNPQSTPAEQRAQQKAIRENTAGMDDVNSTLLKSLETQLASTELLKQLVAIGMSASKNTGSSKPVTDNTSSPVPRDAPRAAVSMARTQ